ncbi:DNA-formamidopyrimidine glycosylase [Lacticaseibacillus sp. N501-2]|uniref:DNA-formamidopyrimidine glycosylase n=1 Tax=Lacticaseibacillus salsurae TaxID=3367729 RepID=UPI0038B295E4
MPELPEVENVRRALSELIVGKTVCGVHTNWEKILIGGSARFAEALTGATVTAVDRRGKYLLLRFDHHLTLVSHLRMEGKYQLAQTANEPPARFLHVWFDFTDGSQLRYLDMRKFGRMQLCDTGSEMQVAGLKTIGPEPTAADFDAEAFFHTLQKHKKPIKSVILDQSVVAGVGNIYADETLWRAKINPMQPACTLKRREADALHDQIIAVLAASIKLGGTTVHTFISADGQTGGFQNQLRVYGKQGTPCVRCGTLIVKTKVGQRGTHYCPGCQKLRKRVIH